MDSLYLLVPAAVIFSGVGIWLLLWAIDNGQYEDLDKEGWRVLMDEDASLSAQEKKDKHECP